MKKTNLKWPKWSITLTMSCLFSNYVIAESAKKCPDHLIPFENQCIKIPQNAHPSNEFPGWDCDEGYVQKRDECLKMFKPKGSKINQGGNSWACKDGYESYRGTCRKK